MTVAGSVVTLSSIGGGIAWPHVDGTVKGAIRCA